MNSETAEKKQAPEFSNDELSNGLNIELSKFDAYRVTKEKQIPNPPPTATIGDSPILAAGNITPMTAEAKGGKTAAANVFIAGAISDSGNYDGFNDLFIQSNPSGKAVLHFDTEQSEADQQYNLKTSLTRAGYNSTPDYYRSYNTRTLPINEYQNFTSTICELASECFNGIHLIVIDGGADYITSVNDEAEANAIITYFIFLAVKYNCPVLLVIHLNENAGRNGDTMPRGHVGRQAVRKGYCQLHITKTGDISTMQVLRARKAGNDTPVICYQYSKDHGYHISVDAAIAGAKCSRSSVLRNNLESICKEVLPLGASLSYTQLRDELSQTTDKSAGAAKRYIENLESWKAIKKGPDGNYRIINN